MKLPYFLFSSFNRKSLISFKILKDTEDNSDGEYFFGNDNCFYKFYSKSKYHMVRGFVE